MEQFVKTYPGKYIVKCYIDDGIFTTIYLVPEENGKVYVETYIGNKLVVRNEILDLN